MITDYFKLGPKPLASPVPSPAVKQQMQKRQVGRPRKRSSVAVAIFSLPILWHSRYDFCVTEITPNYNVTRIHKGCYGFSFLACILIKSGSVVMACAAT